MRRLSVFSCAVLCFSVEPTTSVIIASSRHQRDKVYTCLKILSATEGILMRQQRQHSMVLHERSAQLHSAEDLLEEKEERLAQQQMELEAQRQLLLEKDKEIEKLQQKQKQLEEEAQAASSGKAPAFRPKIGGGPGGKAAGSPLKPGGGGGDLQRANQNLQRQLDIAEAENTRLRRETEIMKQIIEDYEKSGDDDDGDDDDDESVYYNPRFRGGGQSNPVVTAARRGSALAAKIVSPLIKQKH
ncbi:hypothetical protein CSUI_011482 [Cystoisospora suis]|uniref:Uncharacterized protein n=1 Tax=Cystoisospora suis TaxID=483139 RepID=A0A2C6KDA1_9APIC|nr:hypothetical protein CSUI_011482 [Cystoisospora suis]